MIEITEQIKHYNSIKANAFSSFKAGNLEKALDYIYIAGLMAWQNHLGFWCDDELENLLLQIGMKIRDDNSSKKNTGGSKKITFIGSNIMVKKGLCAGHCGVLKQWAELLGYDSQKQSLYITHCHPYNTSRLKIESLAGVPAYNLSEHESYLKRIHDLINHINDDAPDDIFLFIDPNDVIAITALNALQNKPRIFFFNHADHLFWLGKSAANYFIEFRGKGAEYSKKYRNINESYIIPLTASIKPKKSSLIEWKIKKNATISISIGRFNKVMADNGIYFRTIRELLERFPNHYHIFVTDPPSFDFIKEYLGDNEDIKERFIITGPYSDLSPFYGMADFLIDTFPESGSMVQIEAMSCKLPVVAYFNKKFSLASAMDFLPSKYPFIGSTKGEIINHSAELIGNPEIKKYWGKRLYSIYHQELAPENIQKTLMNILYNNQKPVKTPLEECEYDREYVRGLYGSEKSEIYNRLIIQSVFKDSEFSIKDNFGFYLNALKNDEFNVKQKLMYALMSLIGFKGVSMYLKLH